MSPELPHPIPPAFLTRMQRFLGPEYPDFLAALDEKPVSGLRVNTLKLPPEEFSRISPFPLGPPVDWCSSAFHLPDSAEIDGNKKNGSKNPLEPGKHPFHLAGLYYLQDPSAMSAAELLKPCPGERVLDLAASPGGKTTALAALMKGQGLLVANEIKEKRLGHLLVNVERWGAPNVVVTNETPERLVDHFGAFFDRVLVDAPCSGEGMFRKDMGARRDWSINMVTGCALRQRNILRIAAKLVRPGGYLLYSTCTFAPEEDEGVVANFLSEFTDYEIIPLPLFSGFMQGRPDWLEGVPPSKSRRNRRTSESLIFESLKNAVHLFPHRLTGEGHFACLLKRAHVAPTRYQPGALFDHQFSLPTKRTIGLWERFSGEYLRADFPEEDLRLLGDRLYLVTPGLPDMRGLRVSLPGIWLGNIKKDRFEPAHPLALYLRKDQAVNNLDLPESGPEIAAFLRGESLQSEGPSGWTLVCVDGWPLAWGKRVQGTVKNHLPRGWKVYS
jgi:16S rRNA C967 or C1407 C5-methylase (RsmB/RsmF family)/NOL1/NOP2/fmu family ribosome biogenesis protein